MLFLAYDFRRETIFMEQIKTPEDMQVTQATLEMQRVIHA
jgi:hypothetical protein